MANVEKKGLFWQNLGSWCTGYVLTEVFTGLEDKDKILIAGQWWFMLLVLALRRQKPADLQSKLQEKPYLENKKNKTRSLLFAFWNMELPIK